MMISALSFASGAMAMASVLTLTEIRICFGILSVAFMGAAIAMTVSGFA